MIDVNLLNRMIKGIKSVEGPVRRINQIDLRIYKLSKMLPAEEGRELIRLHDEGKQKAVEAFTGFRKAVDEEE